MSGAPLVSVIIPAYQAASTIGRAVRSLLAQSLADWEAIVVSDDGADYRALLAAEGIADPRLVFAATGGIGTGAAAARNLGLRRAEGRLVAPLDADDAYAPSRLALMAPLALDAGAAFDNVRVVDDASGAPLFVLFDRRADFALDAAAFLETSVPLMPVARRELIEGWDPEIEMCDDVALNLRLFARVPAIPVTAEPLHDYRVRQGSMCHSDRSAERAEHSYNALLRRLAEEDGYGLGDAALVALATEKIAAKRAFNRAFAEAREAGLVETFQEFVALNRSASSGL
ncbi:MAG: glycosyltransferase family 2 protein [Alphaproteobacteria bacterium]